MLTSPFIIMALPRSRTAWLSRYLSYKDWTCSHEEIRHLRGLDDVKSWLSQDKVGSAETSVAPYWRLIEKYRPDTKILLVRRPVEECVKSILNLDMQGVFKFEEDKLKARFQVLDTKLDQIKKRYPNVMSVDYHSLVEENTCAKVFEYCLPYRHSTQHWHSLKDVNIQCSVPALTRYAGAFYVQLNRVSNIAKQAMLTDITLKHTIVPFGISFQEDPFESFYTDSQPLFKEHLAQVGEDTLAFETKNLALMRELEAKNNLQIVTARSNGKVFGYLMSVLSPSLESPLIKTAIHTTFFSSSAVPGLGIKLMKYANKRLKSKGIGELFLRAGPRGSGPKMGTLYRRLGAVDDGQMFRLDLRDA